MLDNNSQDDWILVQVENLLCWSVEFRILFMSTPIYDFNILQE